MEVASFLYRVMFQAWVMLQAPGVRGAPGLVIGAAEESAASHHGALRATGVVSGSLGTHQRGAGAAMNQSYAAEFGVSSHHLFIN